MVVRIWLLKHKYFNKEGFPNVGTLYMNLWMGRWALEHSPDFSEEKNVMDSLLHLSIH